MPAQIWAGRRVAVGCSALKPSRSIAKRPEKSQTHWKLSHGPPGLVLCIPCFPATHATRPHRRSCRRAHLFSAPTVVDCKIAARVPVGSQLRVHLSNGRSQHSVTVVATSHRHRLRLAAVISLHHHAQQSEKSATQISKKPVAAKKSIIPAK